MTKDYLAEENIILLTNKVFDVLTLAADIPARHTALALAVATEIVASAKQSGDDKMDVARLMYEQVKGFVGNPIFVDWVESSIAWRVQ
jgi:hypothetical protein